MTVSGLFTNVTALLEDLLSLCIEGQQSDHSADMH